MDAITAAGKELIPKPRETLVRQTLRVYLCRRSPGLNNPLTRVTITTRPNQTVCPAVNFKTLRVKYTGLKNSPGVISFARCWGHLPIRIIISHYEVYVDVRKGIIYTYRCIAAISHIVFFGGKKLSRHGFHLIYIQALHSLLHVIKVNTVGG